MLSRVESRLWADAGAPVPHLGLLRLEHVATKRNLHSHEIASAVTGQQEVSAFGENGEGDANCNWRVHYEDAGGLMRLEHELTGHRLHSHELNYPDWGFEQQEVTCFEGVDENDLWRVQEVQMTM